MLNNLLRDAVDIILGKSSSEIVDILKKESYVSEFVVAKKLDLTVNQARNLLYKLLNKGVVVFDRKRDKKKGWYIYSWKLDVIKSLIFLRNDLLKRLNQLESQRESRLNKRFYKCSRCNIEMSEENALQNNFHCIECGGLLELKNNAKLLKEMEKRMISIKNKIEIVNDEIRKQKEKLTKNKVEVKEKKQPKKRLTKKTVSSKKLIVKKKRIKNSPKKVKKSNPLKKKLKNKKVSNKKDKKKSNSTIKKKIKKIAKRMGSKKKVKRK